MPASEVLLRAWLLGGLVAHKAVWEVFKRRQTRKAASSAGQRSGMARAAAAVKIAILCFLAVQTVLPPLLPMNLGQARWWGLGIFTVGLATAIAARVQLGGNWSDIEKAAVLPGQQVVSRGIYQYIRHPIYTGDLLLLAGFEVALDSWLVAGVALLVPVVVSRALREEAQLRDALPGYSLYCRRTKRFLPLVL